MKGTVAILLLVAGLTSCGSLGKALHRNKKDAAGGMGQPPIPGAGLGGTIDIPRVTVGGRAMSPRGAQTASAASSVSAAGGNPMFDFSSAFSQGMGIAHSVNWRISGSEAAVESRRAGRPMLLLLTDPRLPTSARLEMTLGVKPEMGELISSKFIPLRVDFSDKRTLDSDYYRALKNRYKPKGYPVLIAVLPDGSEVSRQSGYSVEVKAGSKWQEQYDADWQKRTQKWIESAALQADKSAAARRKKLEAQGYRMWTNAQGKPVFARLSKLDANQAQFIGEWGETFNTFTNRLSESDREAVRKANEPHQEKPQAQ